MKLSVCIPIYNVAAYVERCARSLFEQTYPDIEYLFVALRNLARVILYWGTAYGLLSGSEQVRWRRIYLSKGGRYDFSDMSVWGRRIMKLAWHSPALARCLAICSKGRLDDYL